MSKRVSLDNRKGRTVNPVTILVGSQERDDNQQEIQTPEKPKKQKKQKKTLIRQTYHMDPVIIEAVKIIDFETREGISSIVNRILRENIDMSTLAQAEKNLQKRGML